MNPLMSDAFGAPPPQDVYLTLIAMIDQMATQRLINELLHASQNNFHRAHVLLQSSGGTMSDGILLHEILPTLPIAVTMYNSGNIMSAGVLAYLGARKRVVSKSGVFMLHRGQTNLQSAYAKLASARMAGLSIEDQRLDAIYKTHLKLSPKQWDLYENAELWLSADDAVAAGLATEIGPFRPPSGAPFHNVFAY